MTHTLATSGSTIFSDPAKYHSMLWEGIEHIEMGEFYDEEAFQQFLKLVEDNNLSFGIHSPLFRGTCKYDLIQKVHFDPKTAWKQLDAEAERLSALGAEYILVHFPFFLEEKEGDTNTIIEEGLIGLSKIKQKHNIEIVCEPKLGQNRSSAGIHYLNRFPVETWAKYDLKLCIDIGDYLLAVGNNILDYLHKWRPFIKVVHLHNIDYIGERYIWIPVHPSGEVTGHYKIKPIIDYLMTLEEIQFVFEHTPELIPSEEYIEEGYQWVRRLVYGE